VSRIFRGDALSYIRFVLSPMGRPFGVGRREATPSTQGESVASALLKRESQSPP
jgi:hypothetical protein